MLQDVLSCRPSRCQAAKRGSDQSQFIATASPTSMNTGVERGLEAEQRTVVPQAMSMNFQGVAYRLRPFFFRRSQLSKPPLSDHPYCTSNTNTNWQASLALCARIATRTQAAASSRMSATLYSRIWQQAGHVSLPSCSAASVINIEKTLPQFLQESSTLISLILPLF